MHNPGAQSATGRLSRARGNPGPFTLEKNNDSLSELRALRGEIFPFSKLRKPRNFAAIVVCNFEGI